MVEIFRNLSRRKLRSLLTISGIVIGILALTTMGALAENFNALLAGGVTYYGDHIEVADNSGQGSLLPLPKADEIKAVNGVQAVYPGITLAAKPGAVVTVSFSIPDYISSYVPGSEQYSSFKLTVASGQRLAADARGDVMLGSTIAKEFKKSVGDSLDLPVRPSDAKPDFVNHTFKVVGILDPTQTAPDTGAYVSLADAQMLMGDSLPLALRGKLDTSTVAQGFVVYGKPGVNLDQLSDTINNQVTGVKATKPSTIVQSFQSGGAIFTAITTAAALLALIIGGISVTNTMLMAVTERIREIGLKKAVGAKRRHIMVDFLLESIVIGVVGGVVGFGLGLLLTVLLNAAGSAANQQLFLITPRLVALCLGFAVALAAVAGIIPAARAAAMDPVRALRYE